MARKGFLELAADAPWPVGFVAGIVAFGGCQWIVPAILAGSDNVFLKPFGQKWQESGMFWVGYAFLAVFWCGALISFLRKRKLIRAQRRTSEAGFSALATDVEPTCPKCGQSMVMRTARAGGEKFWGCSTYPQCRGTLPVGSAA